ncbi:hypothetical protein SAY86_007708 [Trapa natans]|uniref:Uncharacterized protein n=1 Tax=Trapa natans TaxID=22666 RepID=A0AAN7QX81_TRANT|nr:hypothetical protein SAY86_007708 [Trapa natans]
MASCQGCHDAFKDPRGWRDRAVVRSSVNKNGANSCHHQQKAISRKEAIAQSYLELVQVTANSHAGSAADGPNGCVSAGPRKLIIDTDPGIGDCFHVSSALSSFVSRFKVILRPPNTVFTSGADIVVVRINITTQIKLTDEDIQKEDMLKFWVKCASPARISM